MKVGVYKVMQFLNLPRECHRRSKDPATSS